MTAHLDNPALLGVSEEDIAIYNTPDGMLYQQHLVDEAFEIYIDTKHFKKENKIYSHEEQVCVF